jgi:hypothetical protein
MIGLARRGIATAAPAVSARPKFCGVTSALNVPVGEGLKGSVLPNENSRPPLTGVFVTFDHEDAVPELNVPVTVLPVAPKLKSGYGGA